MVKFLLFSDIYGYIYGYLLVFLGDWQLLKTLKAQEIPLG